MVRVHERGSSLWYIVVGVVLAGLVVGGVYFVKHQLQGQLARTSSTNGAITGNTTSDTKKSDESSSSSEVPATSQDKSTSDSSSSGSQNQQSQAASGDSSSSSNATSAPVSNSGSGSNLPQTGPAGAIGTAVILAMLFGAYTAYRRSLKLS